MQQKLSFRKSPSLCKQFFLKFRYSEKATKFQKNLPLLSLRIDFEKRQDFLSNFVAFSQYLNFKIFSELKKKSKQFCSEFFLVPFFKLPHLKKYVHKFQKQQPRFLQMIYNTNCYCEKNTSRGKKKSRSHIII